MAKTLLAPWFLFTEAVPQSALGEARARMRRSATGHFFEVFRIPRSLHRDLRSGRIDFPKIV